jgi:hypothetical protein
MALIGAVSNDFKPVTCSIVDIHAHCAMFGAVYSCDNLWLGPGQAGKVEATGSKKEIVIDILEECLCNVL